MAKLANLKIVKSNLSSAAPLFVVYQGHSQPQDAFIELHQDGYLSADYSGEIGEATPMREFTGRAMRWPVPPTIRRDKLRLLFSDACFIGLMCRILGGMNEAAATGRVSVSAVVAEQEAAKMIERNVHNEDWNITPRQIKRLMKLSDCSGRDF